MLGDSFRIKAAAQRIVKIFRVKSKYQKQKQRKEELSRMFYSGELLRARRGGGSGSGDGTQSFVVDP